VLADWSITKHANVVYVHSFIDDALWSHFYIYQK